MLFFARILNQVSVWRRLSGPCTEIMSSCRSTKNEDLLQFFSTGTSHSTVSWKQWSFSTAMSALLFHGWIRSSCLVSCMDGQDGLDWDEAARDDYMLQADGENDVNQWEGLQKKSTVRKRHYRPGLIHEWDEESAAETINSEPVDPSPRLTGPELSERIRNSSGQLVSSSRPIAPAVQPQIDSELFNLQLRMNRSSNLPDRLRQPWEKGPMAFILGSGPFPSNLGSSWIRQSVALPPIPAAPESKASSVVHPTSLKRPVLSSALLRIKRLVPAPFQGEPLRFRALNRWKTIVGLDYYSSKVGRQLVDYALDGTVEVLIDQTIEDTMSRKSTNTLLKRASAIIKYVSFLKVHFQARTLVYKEEWLYQYVNWLRANRAAPSTGKSLLEALNFAIHTIGPDILEEGWKSQRVNGACESMYVRKDPTRQADPLKVVEVKLLHHILSNSSVLEDRLVAGYCLFLTYGTCRWSDPQKPERFDVDVVDGAGYLELGTRDHKCASATERKMVLMPLVATSPGLGHPIPGWIDEWLHVRELSGLKFVDHPTMPSRLVTGEWSTEPMSASEGSAWLKELLQTYGPSLDPQRKVTSHSLKSTGLSWAAKRPLKKSFRRALGHHVDSNDKSVAVYSRDYMFAALQAFDVMLAEIVDGDFHPDDSRAQRAREKAKRTKTASGAVLHARQVPQSFGNDLEEEGHKESELSSPHPVDEIDQKGETGKVEGEISGSETSSESSSSSEASLDNPMQEESEAAALNPDQERDFYPKFYDVNGLEVPVYQHTISGVLHAGVVGAKLACGRILSGSYSKITQKLKFNWPKCELCNRKFPERAFLVPTPKAKALADNKPHNEAEASSSLEKPCDVGVSN